jgi:hypothetical protein
VLLPRSSACFVVYELMVVGFDTINIVVLLQADCDHVVDHLPRGGTAPNKHDTVRTIPWF